MIFKINGYQETEHTGLIDVVLTTNSLNNNQLVNYYC